jgi:hypothetical protein
MMAAAWAARAPVHGRPAPRFRVGRSPAGDSALFGKITKDGIVEVLGEALRDRTRMAQGEEGRPRGLRRPNRRPQYPETKSFQFPIQAGRKDRIAVLNEELALTITRQGFTKLL